MRTKYLIIEMLQAMLGVDIGLYAWRSIPFGGDGFLCIHKSMFPQNNMQFTFPGVPLGCIQMRLIIISDELV